MCVTDVRFYDYEGNLKAIAAHKESVNWVLCYNDTGTFEMHISASAPQTETILKSEYLIAVQGTRQAIIVEKQLVGNDLGIFGRTPSYLLSKRVVKPFEEEELTAIEAIEKHALPEYMTLQNDARGEYEKRKISRDTIEDAQTFIKAILNEDSLGYEVIWKRGAGGGVGWILRIYDGTEVKKPVSEEKRTATDLTYTDSRTEYASCGYWREKETEEWTEIVKDAEKTGVYREEAVLEADGELDAKRELSSMAAKKTAKGALRGLKFGVDYNLGDILTVQIARGNIRAASKYRVTQAHVYEESGASGEEPTFTEVK